MSTSTIAVALADAEPSPLRHWSTYLLQPVGSPQLQLNARPDLHKCAGSTLSACANCSRRLAPAATVGQQWVQPPASDANACTRHADVSVFGHLYAASSGLPGEM